MEAMISVGKQYFDLVTRSPLVPIRDAEHLRRANALAVELALQNGAGKLNEEEIAYLAVLQNLITSHESERYNFRKLDPVELVLFLMEENALTQVDVAQL